MPSSHRRKILRLQLGVNRKLTGIRWMGMWTVRVHVVSLGSRDGSQLKADKGAEKSSPSGKAERIYARGKSKPRGAPEGEEPKIRTIMKHLRCLDHWYGRQEQLRKLFLQSQLYQQLKHGQPRGEVSWTSWKVWRDRWKSLHDRVTLSCRDESRIGPTFTYWLEQRFGIIWKPKLQPTGRPYDRRISLALVPSRAVLELTEMRAAIHYRTQERAERNRPNRPHRHTLSCDWCRTSWSYHNRQGFCPGCRRLCVALGRPSRGRRRFAG
jgi:hypothetical protein